MEGNRENRAERREEQRLEQKDEKTLLAEGRNHKRNDTRKINRLWLWFGVLVLIFILLWWLWSIGIFEDITGISNG